MKYQHEAKVVRVIAAVDRLAQEIRQASEAIRAKIDLRTGQPAQHRPGASGKTYRSALGD